MSTPSLAHPALALLSQSAPDGLGIGAQSERTGRESRIGRDGQGSLALALMGYGSGRRERDRAYLYREGLVKCI